MQTTGSGASLTARDSAPHMRRSCSFLLAVSAASCAALAALAQSPPRQPRPYEPVTITRLAASDDASLAAFRTVLAAPQPGAAKVGTLGLHFVRLLGFEGADSEVSPGRTQWARVALPDGKQGFVAPGSLMSLTAERLCYIKDLVAGWRIAGYVAGG